MQIQRKFFEVSGMSNGSGYVGKQIGSYYIIKELASGSFGSVYQGRHAIFTERPFVAIKLLHTHLSSPDEHKRFIQEAQLLEKLRHPHILSIIDASIHEGLPYLVAEYASHGSLRERLLRQQPSRPLPTEEAVTILTQIGQALQYAHQQGVVHRDLKPENILFNAKGEALLADFGIASVLESATKKQTAIMGTPAYMAPEQFRGTVSRESDQYALGCIAYELFTGHQPFSAPDFIAMGFKHLSENATTPTQLNRQLPIYIEQAILKAMAKEHAKRHLDITAFTTSLHKSPKQWLDEGDAHHVFERYAEALAAYEQAIRLDPNLAPAYNAKGMVFFSLGRHEEALAAYEKAVQLDSKNIVYHHNKKRQEEELRRRQGAQYSPVREAPCPNCGKMIPTYSEFCPYCRTPLTPSASGRFNAQQQPPPPMAQGQSVPPYAYAPSSGPPPALPPEPLVRYGHGRNLSLAVGTQSDRGRKRQHKENEDSIFAAVGVRKNNVVAQQFGLFVVADGMSDHANGQDASRLAISTIIHYLLPILSQTEELSDTAYLKLLTEGVQQANMAVHNRNMEQRAGIDMGTTMTAALVVESTAYIANVGDSRTYLYREGAGLRKVTHDHSVVEALVDAGVIQKDDVYTHPKHNQVYRNLGEKSPVEVDAFKEHLMPGDKLLLCSDGLWKMVRDPNIEHILKYLPTDPGGASAQLLQAALDGGGEENVSLIVVQIAERSERNKKLYIRLLAKPDTVEVPKTDIPITMPS